jgi:5-methylcytosine-specific restriction endonuclease McrA
MKTCRKCGNTSDDFRDEKRNRDGLRSYCRPCDRADGKAKYAANPEEARARKMKWRLENPEAWSATIMRYYKNHITEERARCRRWRAENREKARAAVSNWTKNNPEEVRVRNNQRKALFYKASGSATSEQIQARIDLFGGMCAYCRVKPCEHVDHVIPLSRGGSNWPANLRPACADCNLRKHASTWREITFGQPVDGADLLRLEQ